MSTNNDNLIGFRAPTEKEKDRIKKEAEALGLSIYDLVISGLKVEKKTNSESNILHRKKQAVNERNDYISKVIEKNALIKALNRQLKDRFSKYEELSEEDQVVNIYNDKGNRLF